MDRSEPARIGVRRNAAQSRKKSRKKVENLAAAVSLHFMHYNFVRIRQTLKITPAMAAGVTNRFVEIADIVGLLEEREKVASA